MPEKKKKPATSRGLYRVTAYLHEDELKAVEKMARKERASNSEIIRRLVRKEFKIED